MVSFAITIQLDTMEKIESEQAVRRWSVSKVCSTNESGQSGIAALLAIYVERLAGMLYRHASAALSSFSVRVAFSPFTHIQGNSVH